MFVNINKYVSKYDLRRQIINLNMFLYRLKPQGCRGVTRFSPEINSRERVDGRPSRQFCGKPLGFSER